MNYYKHRYLSQFKNIGKGNFEQHEKPECVIKINGVSVKNWIDFEVNDTIVGHVDSHLDFKDKQRSVNAMANSGIKL